MPANDGEYKQYEDKTLIGMHTDGDEHAFEELVFRYERMIVATAYRLCGDREEGEDLAQETFVKAWRGISGYRGQASFGTWLAAILTNTWRDRLRKGQVPKESLDATIEGEEGAIPKQYSDGAPGPESIAEEKEQADHLGGMIQTLKQEYKEALILRDIQGFSYEEVADILGVNLGTVKSRINRARAQLREKILAYQELNPGFFRLNQVRTDGNKAGDRIGGDTDEG